MASRRKNTESNEDVSVTDSNVAVMEVPDDAESRAAAPEFFTEFVDELPENDRKRGGRGRGPSLAYYNALNVVKSKPGVWGTIAKFHTPTGATTALRNIKAGTKIVPEDIESFEFETRRATDERGERYSILFARYNG